MTRIPQYHQKRKSKLFRTMCIKSDEKSFGRNLTADANLRGS